jgi:hypothetical protein
MAGEREELERLRKLKRLRELEAKAAGQAPTPEALKEPGFLERLGAGVKTAEQTAEQISPVTQLGRAAERGVRGVFERGGEALAETLPQGIVPQQIPGTPFMAARPAQPGEEAITAPPEVAAALGTGAALAPDIAAAALGGAGAIAGKRVGQAALRRAFTSRGIGERIGEAERAAGVMQQLPETKNLTSALNLPKGTSFTKAVNTLEQSIDAGLGVGKQTLSDAKILIKKALNTQAFSQGQPRALLTRIASKVDDAFDKAIPGRAKLSKKFKSAKGREELLENVLRGGKKAAKTAAVAAGLGALGFQIFK